MRNEVQIGLEEMVEHTRLARFDVEVAKGELLHSISNGVTHFIMAVEHAHNARSVRARFTVHHAGIFYFVKQITRAQYFLYRMNIARIHAVIDERNPMRLARLFFEQIIAFGAFPAQVQDGLNPHRRELLNTLWRRLIGAVHPPANLMHIVKARAQKPMITPC